MEVSPGQNDVVLVLDDAARIFGSLILDEGLDPADLSLVLIAPTLRSTWSPDADGTFERSRVPIGRSLLAVYADSWVGPSLQLLEIDVEPGEQIRLDPIDLRGRLMTSRLIVEGPDGELIRHIIVRTDPDGPIQHIIYTMGSAVARPIRFEEGGSTGPVPSSSRRDGQHIFLHAEPLEVEIDAEGLRAVRCTLEGGADRVRLSEGFDVELRLIGVDRLPPTVRASISLDRELARERRGSVSQVSGYARFKLRSPGTWTGRVHVVQACPDSGDSARGQEIRVEVREVSGVQRFDIHLDERTFEPARELARGIAD